MIGDAACELGEYGLPPLFFVSEIPPQICLGLGKGKQIPSEQEKLLAAPFALFDVVMSLRRV